MVSLKENKQQLFTLLTVPLIVRDLVLKQTNCHGNTFDIVVSWISVSYVITCYLILKKFKLATFIISSSCTRI